MTSNPVSFRLDPSVPESKAPRDPLRVRLHTLPESSLLPRSEGHSAALRRAGLVWNLEGKQSREETIDRVLGRKAAPLFAQVLPIRCRLHRQRRNTPRRSGRRSSARSSTWRSRRRTFYNRSGTSGSCGPHPRSRTFRNPKPLSFTTIGQRSNGCDRGTLPRWNIDPGPPEVPPAPFPPARGRSRVPFCNLDTLDVPILGSRAFRAPRSAV